MATEPQNPWKRREKHREKQILAGRLKKRSLKTKEKKDRAVLRCWRFSIAGIWAQFAAKLLQWFEGQGGGPKLKNALHPVPARGFIGPATTQNLVVKFDGEICDGVLVENAADDFPSKRSSKISFQTSPEVRHQFRRKLRQLHSGNRWCLDLLCQKAQF